MIGSPRVPAARHAKTLVTAAAVSVVTGCGSLVDSRSDQPTPAPPGAAPDASLLIDTSKPPPAGMLLVDKGVATPFYVDRAPGTNAEYAPFRVKHTYAREDAERPVVDVPNDYAFAMAIAWAAAAGIAQGYPDDTFRPGQAVTRQAVAAYLCRLAAYTPPFEFSPGPE